MQIPSSLKQFLDKEALLVVAGKVDGKIYRIADGEISHVAHLTNLPPSYSDDEGFFFRGQGPAAGGSAGATKEYDESVYVKEFEKIVATELDALINSELASVLYVFEPEHLKGRIVDKLQEHPELTVHTVRYGNYVHEDPLTLLTYVQEYIDDAKVTPTTEDFDRDLERYT